MKILHFKTIREKTPFFYANAKNYHFFCGIFEGPHPLKPALCAPLFIFSTYYFCVITVYELLCTINIIHILHIIISVSSTKY